MNPILIAADLFDPPTPEWHRDAHPGQLPPPGKWRVWYVRGGRGGGKTWTGANVLADWIREAPPGSEFGIVAPTFGAARRVNVESRKSGLLKALGLDRNYPGWNRSDYQLTMPNGTSVFIDGADRGAKNINGLNLAGLWADEVGLWHDGEYAWDESIMPAVRLEGARIIVTGTPKRAHPLVRRLLRGDQERGTPPEADVFSVLRTRDNIDNLTAEAVDDLYRRYKGTNLEAQELEGELLDEAKGALWTRQTGNPEKGLIVTGKPPTVIVRIGNRSINAPDLPRTIIAVDPAVTANPNSSEWGIVVAALGGDDRIYIRADLSGRLSPDDAAKRIVQAYDDWEVDRIVVEVNQGGDLVRSLLHGARPNLPITERRAYKGKYLRAEPVQGAYQRGKVIHEHQFAELEEQMCTWEPDGGDPSPDRIDALVYAVAELDAGNTGRVVQGGVHPFG